MPGQHEILREAADKMDKSVVAFQTELSHIRTGRANTGLVEALQVEVYGSVMPLNQLANLTAPDPHLIVIDVWDKSQLSAIERAIQASDLGLTPSNDGTVIRVPVPQLNEERRKELVKVAHKHAEDAKIAIRSIRRHAVDSVKKLQKDGELPEDDAHKMTDDVQKLTDDHTNRIEEQLKHKEEDIMEV